MSMAEQVVGCSWPDYGCVQQVDACDEALSFLSVGEEKPQNFRYGEVNAACGRASVIAIERAARGCLAGEMSGMVTAPINKESVQAAGYTEDIGHQEILSRLIKAKSTATMLMTPGLKVVHLSTHKSLVEAARFVTRDTVLERLLLTDTSLAHWGLQNPHIAVAALNP